MVIRNRKSGAIPGLSCSAAGINPEVVNGAPDEHCLVGKSGFSGSQNICANAGAFDSRNGMLNDDSFARKALVEWLVSRFFTIGSSFRCSHLGMGLRVTRNPPVAKHG